MRIAFFVLGLLFLPTVSSAAVTIHEVAWMGTATSANDEWIELYNSGDGVVVDGWVLSDGMDLEIPLTGTIAAGDYAVLERTDDETVPGAAFLVYTGALVNTGATLTLRDAAGTIVDQVAGGENWQSIGGDNTSKETAQYTSQGWVTGTPTPGAANVPVGSVPTVDETDDEENDDQDEGDTVRTKKANTAGSSETVKLVLPGITLALAIDAQSIAYVNQPITLRATPSGIGDALLASLAYEWNFGDGEVGNQKEVAHTYAYPGTYVVTLHAAYARQWQVARHEITVLPVTFTITTTPQGDIQIHNNAKYDVDISGYQVFGDRRFIFPPRSIMVPQATITLPHKKVGNSDQTIVRLHDQAGALVASTIAPLARTVRARAEAADGGAAATAVAAAPPSPTPLVVPAVAGVTAPPLAAAFAFPDSAEGKAAVSPPTPESATPIVSATQTAVAFASNVPFTSDRLWYAALILLCGFGIMVYISTVGGRPRSVVE